MSFTDVASESALKSTRETLRLARWKLGLAVPGVLVNLVDENGEEGAEGMDVAGQRGLILIGVMAAGERVSASFVVVPDQVGWTVNGRCLLSVESILWRLTRPLLLRASFGLIVDGHYEMVRVIRSPRDLSTVCSCGPTPIRRTCG